MRRLPLALLGLVAVAGCGGSAKSHPQATHVTHARRAPAERAAVPAHPSTPGASAEQLLGLAPVSAGSPLPGYLMIADRDNNRVIVVSPRHRIVWRFPRRGQLAPRQHFAGPDDAFLTPSGRRIITNEEFSDTLAEISLGAHPRIVWSYGHTDAPGSAPGYLAHPDDAYQLPNKLISVADIINCRVLFLDRAGRTVRSIGTAGACTHDPPRALDAPNGDTPLPDGGVLVTEIGGWVDRFNHRGRLRWSIRTPSSYPSDAQLLPNGDVLVAGFETPGRVDILTPHGRRVWTYRVAAGHGALDRPSLAVRLTNGLIAVTDDWNHRVVLIDRRTHRIVWQYGHRGVAGSRRGYLDKPDGLDLLR
jgi:DNA-binding beta-propeller fold protein YncE